MPEIKKKKDGVETDEVIFNLGYDMPPEEVDEFFQQVKAVLGENNVYMSTKEEYRSPSSASEESSGKKKKGRKSSSKENTLGAELADEMSETPNEMSDLLGADAPEVMAEGPSVPLKQWAIPKQA